MTAGADRPAGAGSADLSALRRALEQALEGEVRFDDQAKGLYSTDASHYRHIPLGVVLPRSAGDVEKAVALCRRFGVPLTGRGGGTSLAGQCCNETIVLDFSKYMNRVLEIDAEAGFAWVEPGCVLDDLRDAAEAHGLTFGPDPSTHNHCTLGGMIGNNSCGVHALMAGRTADNVLELEVLTYDGLRLTVGETDEAALSSRAAEEGRRGGIYRAMAEIRERYGEEIRRRFPPIPRRVSGYCLEQLLPENGCNLARALVGTEGTCVTVLRAKLRLIDSPPHRSLVVLGYPGIAEAADAVPAVLEHEPLGLEGLDERLVLYMRSKGMRPHPKALLPEGDGWLLVELGGESAEEAAEKARALVAAADTPWARHVEDEDEAEHLWEVRKSGLGATAHVPMMHETHPGWEDAAVPPHRLGDYLRDFRGLLDRYGYDCAIYGHFGDGCVHCRIDFDLRQQEGIRHYLAFVREAADLVVSYGGSLSGEHGDGQSRGQLLERMYGADLVEAFRRFKAAWDPEGAMNPGKVVDARGPTQDLRLGPDFRPWVPETRFAYPEDGGNFIWAANRCVGVGDCRKHGKAIMCPSYRATYDEAYSTRGRARMLFEMMRGGRDPGGAAAEPVRDRWKSRAVKESLDFCLACKACKSECPVNVDMATYKAEFMHHHYRGRLRPREELSMALIWWWARAGATAPRLVNALLKAPGLSPLAKWAAGFAPQREIPPLAREPFRRWFARSPPPPRGRDRTPPPVERRRVLLWPDTFNAYFTPEPLRSAAAVLAEAGYEVEIPERPLCCGRPLYAPGMLDLARRLWRRNLEVLQPAIRADVPIVVVEPACASAFRDELPNLFPKDEDARRLSRQTRLFGEFLAREGYRPPRLQGRARVHGHCHHRSLLGMEDDLGLLRAGGLEVEALDQTCCGMAGDFGFRRKTYEVAMRTGELAFLPSLRETPDDALFVASGDSCREQARQAGLRPPLTLPEVLQRGLGSEAGTA